MKRLMRLTSLLMITFVAACGGSSTDNASDKSTSDMATVAEPELLYGIDIAGYTIENDTVRMGETVGGILGRRGISAVMVDRLDKAAQEVFPLRQIRADNAYTTFTRHTVDSLGEHDKVDYVVYHRNAIDYVVFGFVGDSVSVSLGSRPVTVVRQCREAVITSSLWGAIMEQELPYALAAEFEDIYQWTVDFFGIQEGDSFKVIYDQKYVDDVSVGIGRIWGAEFHHGGKTFYAIPYAQEEGKLRYWEANGESLRKQLLKAPLKYTRISSKFSNSRLHPVHKVYRPHHGVDYAAPSGTHVHSVADGVVIFAGWGGGGGNTIKIQHAGSIVTGYLHLRGFAKGIRVGTRVTQGQLIGYVGSTGTSTGPHLDYRIWKNGTAIDPLKVPQEPAEPISAEHKERFEAVRDRVMRELEGVATAEERITESDIFPVKQEAATEQSNDDAE
ncbi:MAG: peptidoglycan DD-metalloendopeptidase family protein [Alistipes sp.]|nr:peptidoglycan DD-metalloendopeptidase family protein [Alistipes sp.]